MVFVQDDADKSNLYAPEFVWVPLRSAVEARVGVVKVSAKDGAAGGLRCINVKGFTDMSEQDGQPF